MNYFFDTEFQEYDEFRRIDLISIGIVAEDGREFYAISNEFDQSKLSPWVQEHVIPKLGTAARQPLQQIADGIRKFIGDDKNPSFYAKCGAYDWVLLMRLFGGMLSRPPALPKYFMEIRQEWERLGKPTLPPHPGNEHNALADAKWDKSAWEALSAVAKSSGGGMKI